MFAISSLNCLSTMLNFSWLCRVRETAASPSSIGLRVRHAVAAGDQPQRLDFRQSNKATAVPTAPPALGSCSALERRPVELARRRLQRQCSRPRLARLETEPLRLVARGRRRDRQAHHRPSGRFGAQNRRLVGRKKEKETRGKEEGKGRTVTRVVRIANRANREAPKSGDSRRIARRSINPESPESLFNDTSSAVGT